MALVLPTLQSKILTILQTDKPDADVVSHAEDIGSAYDDYASLAQDVVGNPCINGSKSAFKSALIPILQASVLAPVAAAAYEAAHQAWWPTCTFTTAIPAPGLLSTVITTHTPPTPGIVLGLCLAAFVSPIPVAAVKALMMATAFHVACITVTTSSTGPALPIGIPPALTVGPFPIL